MILPGQFPTDDLASIKKVYGDYVPYLADGDDRDWQSLILAIPVQFPAAINYGTSDTMLTRVTIHRGLRQSLTDIFAQLRAENAWRYVKDCAGAYNFRARKGSKKMSLHAWAAAIDLNTSDYAYGEPADPRDPFVRYVVPVFEHHGWRWGGRFSTPDAHHFEAVRNA